MWGLWGWGGRPRAACHDAPLVAHQHINRGLLQSQGRTVSRVLDTLLQTHPQGLVNPKAQGPGQTSWRLRLQHTPVSHVLAAGMAAR